MKVHVLLWLGIVISVFSHVAQQVYHRSNPLITFALLFIGISLILTSFFLNRCDCGENEEYDDYRSAYLKGRVVGGGSVYASPGKAEYPGLGWVL